MKGQLPYEVRKLKKNLIARGFKKFKISDLPEDIRPDKSTHSRAIFHNVLRKIYIDDKVRLWELVE